MVFRKSRHLWKPESILFKAFWMPDQVRHDGLTDSTDKNYFMPLAFNTFLYPERRTAGRKSPAVLPSFLLENHRKIAKYREQDARDSIAHRKADPRD
jgi:hypothetical protein